MGSIPISPTKKENLINFKFYTAEHSYSISARKPYKNNNGYLGCIAN